MRPLGTTTLLFGIGLTALCQRIRDDDDRDGTPAPGRPPTGADRVARGAYLVSAMGCNDCHTPLQDGPKGPEPDMSRALTGHPADWSCRAADRCHAAVDLAGAGDQHRVRGPVGRELHGEPDAGCRNRPRRLDRGDVHRDDADRTSSRARAVRCCRRCRIRDVGGLTTTTSSRCSRILRSLPPVRNRVPAPIDPPEGQR